MRLSEGVTEKQILKSHLLSKNGLKIALHGLVKELQKKHFKSHPLLKNGLKIALRGLVKELQKKFQITSTSQKWP